MAPKLLIEPLDLSQFSDQPAATNPGFADLVNSELGNQATDGDGYDADVTEVLNLIDFFDTLTGVNNTELDAILALLNTSDPAPIGGALDAFGGVQPTGQGFLDGVDSIGAPSLSPLALLQPSGQAVVQLGGPPSQGGVAQPGAAPYTYHLRLAAVGPGVQNIDANGGDGPDPPFAGFGPVVQEPGADGKMYWVYHIAINPTTPGTYTAQAHSLWHVTFTGITGTIARTNTFQVVIA